MSKDKFVFEWKIGDEVESKSSGEVSVISNECFSNPSRRYKPYGEAKKRYKAEKLAWQQSRMKEGDWVKRIRGAHKNDSSVGYSGGKFQLGSVNEDGYFKEAGANVNHSVTQLKPCKPPKARVSKVFYKVHTFNDLGVSADLLRESVEQIKNQLNGPKPPLESENFKIEDGRLFFKLNGHNEAWGDIRLNGDSGDCLVTKEDMYMSSEYHREIANLLDRSTAKRRS